MFIYFAILKEFKHYVKYFLAKTKEIKNPNNVVEVFKERKKVIRFIRRFLVGKNNVFVKKVYNNYSSR